MTAAFIPPAGFLLGYHVVREAWYSRVAPVPGDETVLTIGLFAAEGGGQRWEFCVEEVPVQCRGCLRVRVFDDGFAAFAAVPEFFARLADLGVGASVEEVVAVLDGLGFVDLTQRERRRDA